MSKRAHFFHLLVLGIILGSGVMLFWAFGASKPMQLVIGLLMAIVYVLWGLGHHAFSGDLHRKVVVEYVLMGTIAIIVLWTVVGS